MKVWSFLLMGRKRKIAFRDLFTSFRVSFQYLSDFGFIKNDQKGVKCLPRSNVIRLRENFVVNHTTGDENFVILEKFFTKIIG